MVNAKLICFFIFLVVANAANFCTTGCKAAVAGAGTACTNDGTNDICNDCSTGYWLKADGHCIATADCGVLNGAEAGLYQLTDPADSKQRCVDATACKAVVVTGPPSVQYLAREKYPTGSGASLVNNPAACVTPTTCASLAGYHANSADKICDTCPTTCDEVVGSCKDSSTASTKGDCWICDVIAVDANTPATSILKVDPAGAVSCIPDATCTTLTTQATTQYYRDNSNSLQAKCKACPDNCNANTGTPAVGQCGYGSQSTGTCLSCDTATPYLKDSTSSLLSPKTCVADATTCPKTGAAGTDLFSVDDTGKRCTFITSSSVSTSSVTASAFNSTPNVVINAGGNATDATAWAVPAAYVKFGAGATNSTIYAYGLKVTSAGGIGSISGIVTRTINATIVSNGSDTTGASVIAGGSLTTVTWPSLSSVTVGGSSYSILTEAVAGYYIVAYTGYESQWQNNLFAYAWSGSSGSSASGKVQISNTANPSGGTTNYWYTPTSIWLEDGVVYIAYTQDKAVYSSTGSGAAVLYGQGNPTITHVGAYIQGFTAATGVVFYNDTAGKTSPKAIYSSETNKVDLALKCGPQNYTNSTYIGCLYNAGTDTDKYSLFFVLVTRATGAAGSPATVATSTLSGTTYPITAVKWYPAGIVTGAYASGGLYYSRNSTQTLSTAATTYAYGLYWYNTTGGSGVFTASGVSASGASLSYASINAYGGTNGLGYYIAAAVDTSTQSTSGGVTTTTTSWTYSIASYMANGTSNGSSVTLASLEAPYANYFLDNNGSLWWGYATEEEGKASTASPAVAQNNIYTGTVGKVYAQLGVWKSFGSVISTFLASLSLVLLALFAF